MGDAMPVALLLAALPALAAATPAAIDPKLKAEFAASDTNKDGWLSRKEVVARTVRMRVKGGPTSPEQMKALGELWFARADANHDNKVTPAEMQGAFIAAFNRYDTNHDGRISEAERMAAKAHAAAEAGPPAPR